MVHLQNPVIYLYHHQSQKSMAFSSFLSELRYIRAAAQKPVRANVQYADLRFYI